MKVTDDFSGMDHIRQELDKLNSQSLQIGIFGEDDSFMAMIAGVNEFGAKIRPKKQYLTIPTKEANGRSARDIQGLFKPKGKKILATSDGNKGLKVMFYLVKEVNIPERSFLRSTFDEKEGEWQEFFTNQIDSLISGSATANSIYSQLGARIASDIQKKIKETSRPSNAAATVANKGTNNPLINTGRLRQSVTWKVV
ncbi:hypothetical protein RAK27_05240 [Carnobacterium maltaromaticum]|uniref:Morphogenesis protein n=1 Tax=Carnobacterium maltaromaticum TaxID=2751 RepID=A0AAW9K3V3_CARML|nr:hypothetical protein [Carnobacterium maltaromaticum]MDZ5758057.1 hypothetical protein [Carnobacterium maltaromaticum]